ncbi:MAG TPA: MopE-related protein [Myxococcota bacterium]|nr:MopE-related protein [Myxococcota bacterium]
MSRISRNPIFIALSFLMAITIAGCSDSPNPQDTLDPDVGDVLAWDTVEQTDTVNETVIRDGLDDAQLPDILDDLPVDATPDIVDTDIVIECPGNYTCDCDSADDCLSGLCVQTMQGSICSKQCGGGSECLDGWTCTIVSQTGTDAVYGCVDMFPDLCKPCRIDADCIPAIGAGNRIFRCINQDDNGSYCGAECVEDRECPEGFTCEDFGEGETAYTQCVPEDGTCECTPRYENSGFLTDCAISNEFGVCEGTRSCSTECDADTPQVETCNRADDNCDGITDNNVPAQGCPLTNTIGTCIGSTICVSGELLCQGAYAQAEECNNEDDDCNGTTDDGLGETTCGVGECVHNILNCENGAIQTCDPLEGSVSEECDGLDNDCDGTTDNGFVDTDLDSLRDCVDPDDDGDEVIDDLDNCPLDRNPQQEDMDTDDIGDVCDDDRDDDEIENDLDNCPNKFNPLQTDINNNGIGDDCEDDWDTDGIVNDADNCPWAANAGQENLDLDEAGDACDCDIDGDLFGNTGKDKSNVNCPAPVPFDNCVSVYNPTQQDRNSNGIGDACEDDWDSDGVKNDVDNCPWIANATQDNLDEDLWGDKCDCDIDGDDVYNTGFDNNNVACPAPIPADNCRIVYNPLQENMDLDPTGDACDCDIDGDGDQNANPGCTTDSDCAPYNPAVFHGATEKCNDVNDDCDGETDEGCDDDDDTFCDVAMTIVGTPQTCTMGGGDCNDNNAGVSPGRGETCNGVDDNCSGTTDEGLGSTTCGVGVCLHTVQNCVGGESQICDAMFGSVDEICDSKDNDCDGQTDEGCDDDGDDFCDSSMVLSGIPSVCPNGGGDCDDNSLQIKPTAIEKCDNIDNNCDQDTDEGCDDDVDGYCDAAMTITGTPTICPNGGNDCNDLVAARNPGASETCNGVDDNCNGSTDEGQGTVTCGLGVCNHTIQKCVGGEVQTCDPMQGATAESCDGLNNDCDAETDEGCDDDGDDYCDNAMSVTGTPAVCPNGGNDCNDAAAAVNPGVAEKCNNINDDCDASTDEGCDDDGDDWCDASMTTVGNPTVCPNGGNDCNDSTTAVRPGATETCNNVDDNCSGITDDNVAAARDTWEPNESCSDTQDIGDVTKGTSGVTYQGKIYPSGDKDYFYVDLLEGSGIDCIPWTDQDFRIIVNLVPPTGADCVDLRAIIYDTGCGELARTTSTGCAAKQVTWDWDGQCGSNDDHSFIIAVIGASTNDWECMGYTITVTMDQI